MRRVGWITRGATVALFVAGHASGHDPFEITTDAHLEAYGLGLHTTLSLNSAARICLPGAAPARRLLAEDFREFRPQFERCAREFYALSSGSERLAVRSLSLQLSPEDDLELRVVYERPSKSPLSFDTSKLVGLPPRAGIVLTVTGRHSFLGQKVLRPDDTRFDCQITSEGEAVGAEAVAAPVPGAGPPRGESARRMRLFGALLVVAVGAMGALIALRRRG